MACAYCGNMWTNGASRCDSCGSARRVPGNTAKCETEALYAKIGRALLDGDPDRSRDVLDRVIGSPQQKEPTRLWTERGTKIAIFLVLLWMFPWLFFVAAFMILPFVLTIYLPYKGLSAFFSWFGEGPQRR
jgi:hypothetical protein